MKILTIENKTGRVKLDDTVDEYSRRQLAKEFSRVFGAEALTNPEFEALTASTENEVDTLEIEINSPGGSVFDGMLIYNELQAMKARGVKVIAIVNVLAASMGSVIAMGASEVQIVKNGRMMIHDASVGAYGNAGKLAKMAELLDTISNEIADIYAAKTGMTREQCRALMLEETWMDSAKCIELGFADAIFDFQQTTNTIGNEMSLLARLTNPSSEEALEKITGLEAIIADKDFEIFGLMDKLKTAENALQEAATLRGEVSDLTAKLTEAESKITDAEATIADMNSKAESAAAAHAAALEEAKKSATAQAVELAAQAGITVPLATEDAPPTSHLDTFNSLKGAEATAYFKQYKTQIAAEQRRLSKTKTN